MEKHLTDFTLRQSVKLTDKYQLLVLEGNSDIELNTIKPGQFVQVKIDNSQSTFLRRPISIHDVNPDEHTITLLVCRAGAGTSALCDTRVGLSINILWPLGNGFTIPGDNRQSVLLVGGGVGVAPLLYLGKTLTRNGFAPEFLLAARTSADLICLDSFKAVGTTHLSTDDGSAGQRGLVTENKILKEKNFDHIYCCGPMPMMKAVARICRERAIDCEVSLENTMACGMGACLCCVEKTVRGNRCVCTDGPVFNINELTW